MRSNNGSPNIDGMGPILRGSSCTHYKNKSGHWIRFDTSVVLMALEA